ncbi:MAG: DUF3800 domain-containing protein [Gammaproteobacteria bacterium]
MLVLIDESGCPGFKLTKGSTRHFIIGMVCFSDFKEAEKVSQVIANLKTTLGLNGEFKFSKTHPNVKDKFFQAVCRYDFTIRALVVDKNCIYSPHLRKENENFYSYFIKQLIHHDDKMLREATVKIDGRGPVEFKKRLSSYLRQTLDGHKIKKLTFSDSRNDSLIQLADMVVGAIARSYVDNRKDEQRWRRMLDKKIDNIWNFI